MGTAVDREFIATLVEAHADAVLTLLRTDPQLEGDVFEGDVDGEPHRYVNVHHDTGVWTSRDYTGLSVDLAVTFTLHSVGMSRWEAVWVSGRVTALLLNAVLQVPGRRTFRIEPAGTQPVALDRDVTPPKHFAVDRFVLRSIPA